MKKAPAKTKRIHFRVSSQEYNSIKKLADKEGPCGISEFIRQLISDFKRSQKIKTMAFEYVLGSKNEKIRNNNKTSGRIK